MKEEVLDKILTSGLVAVVRAQDAVEAAKISRACLAGGISAIEITFTVPRAHQLLGQLKSELGPDGVLLGAGTVLDPETARIAILEGADFLVSPAFNPETQRLANRYRVLCMQGALSPREVVEALEAGSDVIKLFPGEAHGPAYLKALRGPFPQALFMPTGGVNESNLADWVAAGAVALGVGGQLTRLSGQEDHVVISHRAKALVAALRVARGA